jgi:putative addiction module CopG family antidote
LTIHLPEDLERFVRSEVQGGLFASEDEAITEAVRLLRLWKQGQVEPVKPSTKRPLTEAEFKQHLLNIGLMTSLPTPPDPSQREEFQPIEIEGEPLSETIIRERR